MSAPKLFASGTSVSVERSRAEIEKMLARYGVTAFTSSRDARHAALGFAFKGWHVRFELEYPDPGMHYAAGFAMALRAARTIDEEGKLPGTLALCADHYESMGIAVAHVEENPAFFFHLNPEALAARGDA